MASDDKKILLVEDEKAIRDAVAAYLERENYIVRGVGDGQSAVEEFEKHSFDLVILDLMLPKLSGERVCRAIRETSCAFCTRFSFSKTSRTARAAVHARWLPPKVVPN